MKRSIFYISFLIVCFSNLIAEKLEVKYHGNYFWEMTSQSAKVYFLGSIHIATDEFYPLPKIIENAFEESDSLAVEFNVNNVDPFQMLNFGIMKNQTLKDVLDEETYEILIKKFEQYGLPLSMYSNLKPWLAAMLVANMEILSDSINPELGFDIYFLNKAKENKGIIELESLKDQMNIFDIDLKDYQNEFVQFSLEEGNNSGDMIKTYYELWSVGNTEKLEKLVFDEFSEEKFAPIKEALYTKRNYNMAGKISRFFQTDKTYFVVVGAAHLVGKDGIIEILKMKFNN